MKTKNIFAKTLFLTVMFVIPGCSSFLDEENIAGQSAEEYFATAVGYESCVSQLIIQIISPICRLSILPHLNKSLSLHILQLFSLNTCVS